MSRIVFLFVFIILVFLASLSLAGIPHLINYQGMLTDAGGTPIDGARDLTFRIYDDTTGAGTLQWSETQNGVQVNHGLFNVVLGKSTALNLAFDRSYWLEVEVEGEVMPRIRFTSVGYAYRALVADSARTSTPSSDSHWSVVDSVLYTNEYWGIARGGVGNKIYGDSLFTNVNLGVACTTGKSGNDRYYCTVGGGVGNVAAGAWSTVGGGIGNRAIGSYATVGGGDHNTGWSYSNVGGGSWNHAYGSFSTIGGGTEDTTDGYGATIGGGVSNLANEDYTTIAGGYGNNASGICATVGGGAGNTASGKDATVPGGRSNTAEGYASFAAGYYAKANHAGTFVWADSTYGIDFASTGDDQFLIRASGGVGIGTNSPEARLHVQDTNEGVIKVGTPTTNGNATIIFEEGNDDAMALRYDGTENELSIDDETQDTSRMVIELSGKVGIGTRSPQEKLHVWWSTNVDAELGRGVTDTDITYLALRNANGTKCYIYPNAAGNGIVVSTTKP